MFDRLRQCAPFFGLVVWSAVLGLALALQHMTKNVRIRERMRVSIFGEVFNIFNIANLTNYNAALNAPEFGQATQRTPNIFGTGGPRAFQLGSRILF